MFSMPRTNYGKKFVPLFFWVIFLFSFFLGQPTLAALPPVFFTFQGKLTDIGGTSITSAVSMKLVLYNAPTNGTALYSAGGTTALPTAVSVTPTKGLFSISVGDGTLTNTLDPTIFESNQSVYLEVTVNGDTLSPRRQITATPYAYNSLFLNGVAATSTASSSIYIPVSDIFGRFNFNHVTSTDIYVSGTSTMATTTFTGDLSVLQSLVAKALKDNLGWIQNQGNSAKLQTAYNNGGFGGGATPGNVAMTSTQVSTFDITTLDASASGFAGGVFDGRYVYLAPLVGSHAAQYDTQTGLSSAASWKFHTLATDRSGAIFDGRYVYYPNFLNTVWYRFDTSGKFDDNQNWSSFTTTGVDANAFGYIGGTFDGRYIYLSPYRRFGSTFHGLVLRYDTTATFSAAGSYSTFDIASVSSTAIGYQGNIFDGRYVYFFPFRNSATNYDGTFARYDTNQSFSDTGAWSVFDTASINNNSRGFGGAVFDGRFLYFIPSYNGTTYGSQVTRFDTAGSFSATSSWSFFDIALVNSSAKGFYGGSFDGRYVYLAPNSNGSASGITARFDTTAPFTASSSWSVIDLATNNSNAKGYEGIIFDGHYNYFVPDANGTIARMAVQVGGLDSVQGLTKLARGSDLFIDSASNVGLGTTNPTSLLTLFNTNPSTLGITMGNGTTTSTINHFSGITLASTTANPSGIFNVDISTGNIFSSGTLRIFGGSSTGLSISSTPATTTISANFPNTTKGNALVFNTNATIASSTAALYSWRNNGYKLMSLSASGTLDVYGGISSMNASLGTPGTPGDLSENVDVNEQQFEILTPGTLMTIDPSHTDTYQQTTGNRGDTPVGVIATHPSLILGNGKTNHTKTLTFLGRTPTNVSLKNGPIAIGDPLTTATDEPGRAMKANPGDPTFGRALEPYTGYTDDNHGQILVLVGVGGGSGGGSGSPQPADADNGSLYASLRSVGIDIMNGILKVARIITDRLTAHTVTTEKLCVSDVCLTKTELENILQKNGLSGNVPVDPGAPSSTPPVAPDPGAMETSTPPQPDASSTPQ